MNNDLVTAACTHESTGVGAIETEERDRRFAVDGGLRGLGIASGGGEGDTRSCHAGRPGDDTAGEHSGGGVEWSGGPGLLFSSVVVAEDVGGDGFIRIAGTGLPGKVQLQLQLHFNVTPLIRMSFAQVLIISSHTLKTMTARCAQYFSE